MGIYKKLLKNKTRIAIANFLNFEFINKGIWFFNVWSIIHFIVGGLLMTSLILINLNPGTRWIIFISLIIGYEIFELIMSATTKLFKFEQFNDIVWDIILASFAAGIIELIFLII